MLSCVVALSHSFAYSRSFFLMQPMHICIHTSHSLLHSLSLSARVPRNPLYPRVRHSDRSSRSFAAATGYKITTTRARDTLSHASRRDRSCRSETSLSCVMGVIEQRGLALANRRRAADILHLTGRIGDPG